MIRIEILDGLITVSGHACYAPKGKDIVCAAISTLTETLIESLKELTPDEFKIAKSDGRARIEYKDTLSQRSILLVSSFLIGVKGVVEAYPDRIRFFDHRICRGGITAGNLTT